MTVRMYSSLNAGAPALPNLSSQRLIDNLKIVLKACLVDGYGSQAAAGWTVGHEHADGFSLGNGDGFINFVHDSNNIVSVYLMEAITDPTSALAGGVNRRSGPWFDGEATTTRQKWYVPLNGTSAGKSWALAADDKTVTMLLQGNINTTALDRNWGESQAFHFGRWFPVLGGTGFIALGGGTSATSNNTLWLGSIAAGTSLRNPFTGLVGQGTAPGYKPWSAHGSLQSQVFSPAQLSPRVLQLIRAGVGGVGAGLSGGTSPQTAVFGGVLRGLCTDSVLTSANLANTLPAIGVVSPVFNDRLRPLVVGGKQLWPLWPHASDLGGFVSLDAADWEPLWT